MMTSDGRYDMKAKENCYLWGVSDISFVVIYSSMYALCVATAFFVIRLEAEMEGGWTGRDGIYANIGRKWIYSVFCEDRCHYLRPHLNSLFLSCFSLLYL